MNACGSSAKQTKIVFNAATITEKKIEDMPKREGGRKDP